MKTKLKLFSSILFLITAILIGNKGNAQESVPKEVATIVNMTLEEGQAKLKSLGYEICSSSLFNKKQDWLNESAKMCVTVKFDKKSKVIIEVLLNNAVAECQKGLEASRKVWENYHNGQADANSSDINAEREKLRQEGYVVSYWINEVSLGRTMEIWINEQKQSSKSINWNNSSKSDVKVLDRDYKNAKNPAPGSN